MGGFWRLAYPRPEGAHCIGTAAVVFLQGNRARESAKRARKRREQDERRRRTGYVGSAVETAQIVRSELRARGYTHGAQEYGAHLVANGRRWNFQGQFRLAALAGVVRRTVQRYRLQLEADGLIVSNLIPAGYLLDGMRAPTTHLQVARDVSGLLELAQRKPPQPPKRSKPLASTAVATPAPSIAPGPTAEEIRAFALASLAEKPAPTPRRPITDQPPPLAPIVIDETTIEQWERDTAEIEELARRRRQRPPD